MNKKMTNVTKKLLAVYVAGMLLVSSTPYTLALEAPTPPAQPTAPSAPTAPTQPEAPTAPTQPTPPTQPSQPTPPAQPTQPSQPTPPVQPTAPAQPTVTPTPSVAQSSTEIDQTPVGSGGNVGDTTITTGDASTDGNITTTGNTNTSTLNGSTGSGAGASVVNDGNGAQSNNSGTANATSNDNTDQQNQAHVVNNMNEATVTGGNSNSFNVGNSAVVTGDANTTGTIATVVNTNVDGLAVAEFNIADDHVGDYVLDFNAGCVSGCGDGSSVATNTGNGAGSTNEANTSTTNNSNTNQDNDAYVENNMDLLADSGNNDASFNTGGDSVIQTGDANVAANVLTFANNNISGGNVVYSTVNIFGDLYGDIVLTEEAMNAFCGGNCNSDTTTAANIGNGAGSVNEANATTINNSDTAQFNNANIDNNLVFDANTGGNDTNLNTDGGNGIQTGSANVDANVVNVANNNIDSDGNMWLVLVNRAGQWFGQLFGSNEDGTMAGSPGMEFAIGDSGEVTASNNGNGANSQNTTNATTENNESTTQNNNANIVNNINLTANTGNNDANYNTGGNSVVQTGDANIVANVVNFVNNNITGTGKLFVTVVNVFGTWVGDFVTPGHEQASSNYSPEVGGYAASNESSTTQTEQTTEEVIVDTNDYTVASVEYASNNSNYSRTQYSRSAVSGVSDDAGDKTAGNIIPEVAAAEIDSGSTLNINLAWLVFLIPLYLVVTLARKIKVSKLLSR